ncbi:MAG: dephospho-CoA kinase [Bacteroidales bacterium]
MLRIALTGGIATGKSYVLARIAAAGLPTVDADRLVHAALAPGSPAVPLIASRFGPGIVTSAGAVDRRALGAIVFSDDQARRDLEAILHPHVYRVIDEWFEGLEKLRRPKGRKSESPKVHVAVADVPLLYETHHETLFDRVIVTACPRERQLARLKERSGLSDEQARARLAAQWPIEEKMRRADYVIDTSGTFEETDRQVDEVIERLKAKG